MAFIKSLWERSYLLYCTETMPQQGKGAWWSGVWAGALTAPRARARIRPTRAVRPLWLFAKYLVAAMTPSAQSPSCPTSPGVGAGANRRPQWYTHTYNRPTFYRLLVAGSPCIPRPL